MKGELNMIYRKITSKFIEIMARHMNPVWALEELDYLIYDKYASEFYNLSEEEQWEVRSCMMSLDKVYR